MTRIEPLGNRALVLPDPQSDTTRSGLLLPDRARRPAQTGTVLAVGPGERCDRDGRYAPLDVRPGDSVAFAAWAGEWVTVDGVDFRLLRESELLARSSDTDDEKAA